MMYVCIKCGFSTAKWNGKCPQCFEWNTFEEREGTVSKKKGIATMANISILVRANEIKEVKQYRMATGFGELDRVLGGGISKGAVTLIGGDPGIGKSTLLIQILSHVASQGLTVVYVSGEESVSQVNSRLRRVSTDLPQNLFIAAENDVEQIINALSLQEIDFVVIDSIHALNDQEIEGTAGGMSQLKNVTQRLTHWAKKKNVGMFLVGQVTKEGIVAGPKNVEHIVDTVVYLEKIGSENARVVRTVKNRFGEVGEVGFLEMTTRGFIDKKDYSKMLVADETLELPGGALGMTMQGTRPLVVHIQTLINDSIFAIPRRVVEGFSKNKIEVLAAVITKRVPKVYVDKKDIFLKVNGGITVKDSGVDLAVVAAILSAITNIPFKEHIFIGEVGLLGEVKSTPSFEMRVKEAKKLGFKNIITYKTIKNIKELVS